jgi:hypothetical protein
MAAKDLQTDSSSSLCQTSVEFKWEQSKPIAHTRIEAAVQAVSDYHKRPYHEKERVTGAYIGLLDWDGGSVGYFYLEKVWPKSDEGQAKNSWMQKS